MIGITSYGAYIPRLRLDRMSIFQSMGWFAPAIMMVAQGERSMCNWDEDTITMAVAASRDCLKGMDKTCPGRPLSGINHPALCRSAERRHRVRGPEPGQPTDHFRFYVVPERPAARRWSRLSKP